jgi:hypothetical protein
MRRSPRTTLMAIPFVALALAAAGCGSSEIAADEVPGSPPALAVPTDAELSAGGSDADADASADADADSGDAAGDGATAAPETTTPAEPTDPSGSTEAPAEPAPEEGAADPEQPPAGSAPEQFESFCEQNAGAC